MLQRASGRVITSWRADARVAPVLRRYFSFFFGIFSWLLRFLETAADFSKTSQLPLVRLPAWSQLEVMS